MLPSSLQSAIESLSDLPGIGSRSAERLVFNLLRNESGLARKIGEHLVVLKDKIIECDRCCNYTELCTEGIPSHKINHQADKPRISNLEPQTSLCPICQQSKRNPRLLCIVETPVDLVAIERTHEYKGYYHVLHGIISPLKRIGPDNLRIKELFNRDLSQVEEIILATSASTESEATAMYLADKFEQYFAGSERQPRVSRLARGIPSGGDLDYLDAGTLSRAIMDRRDF